MSKTLYLLRHAKSSWLEPGLPDRERVLNKRGRRNAPLIGKALAERIEPLPADVSPAMRAQLTLGGLLDGWPGMRDLAHNTEEALYTFAAADLAEFIRRQEPARRALFLIGHNPAMTDLVNWLCNDIILQNLPTAGFAHLELDLASWDALARGCARLQTTLFPRDLEKT